MLRLFLVCICIWGGLLFNCINAQILPQSSIITITHPLPNQIIQRSLDGKGIIYVTGYHSDPFHKIEARLTPYSTSATSNHHWQTLTTSGKEGHFHGNITGETGWHTLEIRGIYEDNRYVTQQIDSVGIGEIFIIGGASNSMGMLNHGAKGANRNVMSFNRVNKTLNEHGITVVKDQPYDQPIFSQYEQENLAYPTGESAWLWGELGNKISHTLQAPVLFFNVGWAAANSADYRTTIEGKDAYNFYVGQYWPHRQPYSNVINTMRYFTSWLGARSFLWAHGETDAEYTNHTQQQYVDNIALLIQESRLITQQNLHWTIAVGGASLGSATPVHPITHAQVELGTKAGLNTSLGPVTDTIQVPRYNGHFANLAGGVQGLSLAAEAWSKVLNERYFQSVTPVLAKGMIHTGAVPASSYPSASFPIPYRLEGALQENSTLQAELLSLSGEYRAIIGQGNATPIWVTIPQDLPTQHYRIRLTAIAPSYIPGSVSESIMIDSTFTETQFVRHFHWKQTDQHLQLQWLHTAHPHLLSQTLQRSTNSFDYIDLITFDDPINQTTSQLYSYSDDFQHKGITYYRIKSTFKEKVTYSLAIPYFTGQLPDTFTIFPNPIRQDHFLVMTDQQASYQFSLFNQNGIRIPVLVNNNAIQGMATILIPPSEPNGIYHLRIQQQDQTITKRIILQR